MNTIITIGRQYGSGGKEIGKKLAEYYNIPFYDKELLKVAAKESGICEEMFENFDEKPTTSFLYSLVMDPYALGYNAASFDMPLNQKVFLASFCHSFQDMHKPLLLHLVLLYTSFQTISTKIF